VKALLDTSVVVAGTPITVESAAVSVITIAELQYGVLHHPDPFERGRRSLRLSRVQEHYEPLPVDVIVAGAWGHLAAYTTAHGRQPRRRAFDLLIAATAQIHGLTLLTRDADLLWLADVLDVREA